MNDLLRADLKAFAIESNRIERISDPVRDDEHAKALEKFVQLKKITIDDLCEFVRAIEPSARLRFGDDMVSVGSHIPPHPSIMKPQLEELLNEINIPDVYGSSVYEFHCRYECIHPFTDGNGRSGRALWLWRMLKDGWRFQLSFKHWWYYASLRAWRGR